ncbi:MAG: hypothetical protein O4805_06045 [Trichodesmium sp. St16_bin2-tuft]|nr:hypothetical protein [Trichodesmium sp. St16_bin2-tuft]
MKRLDGNLKDARGDFIHKLSTEIIGENQTIVLEVRQVYGMVKNQKFSRGIF